MSYPFFWGAKIAINLLVSNYENIHDDMDLNTANIL